MSNTRANEFPWIELAALLPQGGMKRNHFVRVDDAEATAAWRKGAANRDVFASVCQFEQPSRDARYVCDFFLDIDADDLRSAAADTLAACESLRTHLGIPPESVGLFFSGAKGFHLLVSLLVFGAPDCQGTLPIWRALARRLAKQGALHIDQGVYQPSRVLRLSNSINSKSGLYKVPIEYKELRDMGLDYVLDLAREPRESDSMAMPEESDKAAAWFQDALEWLRARQVQARGRAGSVGGFRNGWRVPPCIRTMEAATLPDGTRHAA